LKHGGEIILKSQNNILISDYKEELIYFYENNGEYFIVRGSDKIYSSCANGGSPIYLTLVDEKITYVCSIQDPERPNNSLYRINVLYQENDKKFEGESHYSIILDINSNKKLFFMYSDLSGPRDDYYYLEK
jgi:hypothetical protein